MASHAESPPNHASPTGDEVTSPKKRRKVNHGNYGHCLEDGLSFFVLIMDCISMYLLQTLGEMPS